jgi:hypothetical protein
MITLETIHSMFHEMRKNAPWDVDGPLLWGYFFTDPDQRKLEQARDYLVAQGYRFVAMFENGEGGTNVLHVERIERHSPDSLHDRNHDFYALADRFGLDSYDGMDVGPAGTPPFSTPASR